VNLSHPWNLRGMNLKLFHHKYAKFHRVGLPSLLHCIIEAALFSFRNNSFDHRHSVVHKTWLHREIPSMESGFLLIKLRRKQLERLCFLINLQSYEPKQWQVAEKKGYSNSMGKES
jgi:hypothetical protein